MIRGFRYAAIGAVAALGVAAVARASSPQQSTVTGFVGTWTCITHSSDGKTYHETDVDTLYGNWLRIDASYPAQAGQAAGTGTTFFGYDAKHARWIVTGVGTDGSYFTAMSTSPAFDGSKWADQYPNDHGTAVLHMTKTTQYSMDQQGPGPSGKVVTQHGVCTKH